MSDSQLQQLIAALSTNSKALEAVLARDPAKEFVYGEGNVGVKRNFSSCEIVEGMTGIVSEEDSSGRLIFAAQCHPQEWRIQHRGLYSSLYTSTIFIRAACRFEFDDNINFRSPMVYDYIYKLQVLPTSYTLDTGAIEAFLDEKIPIRKRYLRVSFGSIINDGTGKFQINTGGMNSLFSFCLAFLVNVLGD